MNTKPRLTELRANGYWIGYSRHDCDVPGEDDPEVRDGGRWRCPEPGCRAWWKYHEHPDAKPRRRINPISKKRREAKPERDAERAKVFARDAGPDGEPVCQLAPAFPDEPCYGHMTVHHLRKASQGGTYTEDNLRAACARHNDFVEENPDVARALGLVL